MICRKCGKEIPEGSKYCNWCGVGQEERPQKKKTKSRGNGQGTVYKTKNGKWQAEITVKSKVVDGKVKRSRRTKGGFSTKKEALEYIPILKQGQTKQAATLESLWEGWESSSLQKLSQSKQGHYRKAFERLFDISSRNIADLTIADLQNVIDKKRYTYYPAKDIKMLLSHLYKRAVAQQDVQANLAEYIVLPDLEEGERKPFTKEELEALWKDYGQGNKLTGYILLMIYSGMMPGELFQAKKDMIDWEKQTITGCGLKTKKRKSTPIVIADMIMPVLKDLCDFSKSESLIDMKRDLFYYEFDKTLQRCGCRDLTPYACRHTTATALALGNIAPSIIQEVMRHTKFSTTQRYIHVDPAPMLEAVNELLDPSKDV